MTQLNHSDVKDVRLQLLEEQQSICPLCGTKIEVCDAVLDHDHDTGLIRGVLHNICNAIEGVLKHKFRRGGGAKYTEYQTFLDNLVVYLKKAQHPMIHPSEKPKEPKLMKSSYNELLRVLKKQGHKKKVPPYPKLKKMTKALQELYDAYDVAPKFYEKAKRGQ